MNSRSFRKRHSVPGKCRSGPVSRVLSRAAISLGRRLPAASSDRPGSRYGPDKSAARRALLPAWSCTRWGLPSQNGHPICWCALTAPFHPCPWLPAPRNERPVGGLLSVALSLSLRTVGVTHHRVLWSPDFPLGGQAPPAAAWPAPATSYSTPRDAHRLHHCLPSNDTGACDERRWRQMLAAATTFRFSIGRRPSPRTGSDFRQIPA